MGRGGSPAGWSTSHRVGDLKVLRHHDAYFVHQLVVIVAKGYEGGPKLFVGDTDAKIWEDSFAAKFRDLGRMAHYWCDLVPVILNNPRVNVEEINLREDRSMEIPSFFIHGASLELKDQSESTALATEFFEFFLARSCALRVMEGALPPRVTISKWWKRS